MAILASIGRWEQRARMALVALLFAGGCTWLNKDDWEDRTDRDHDGFAMWDDCDDADAAIRPDAVDACDGLDNDCSGRADDDAGQHPTWYADGDNDGYGDPEEVIAGCEQPATYVSGSGDCDDADDTVHPDTDEVCDEVDQDCDGSIDEDPIDATTWYADVDGDGFGDELSTLQGCAAPDGYVATASDCEDGDPAVYAGADEVCGDEVDENCDGSLMGCQDALAEADIVLRGEQASHAAGSALAVAPDLNGDGVPDLIVGATGEDSLGADGGAAYVLFGPLRTGAETLAGAEGKVLASAAGELLGTSVGWLDDLDGDGLDEIALGARRATSTKTEGGTVFLMFGPHEGTRDAAADAAIRLDGGKNYDHAGSRLLGGADLTDDGLSDLVVGAWDAGGAAATDNPGVVYILDLATPPASGSLLPSVAAITIEGDAGADGLGTSLASGDLDGNGLSDLMIGMELDATVGAEAGAVYIFTDPREGAWVTTDADIGYLGDAGDQVGRSVVFCDVDGDGYDDVIAGGPAGGDGLDAAAELVNPGVVWVITQRDGGSNLFSGEADLAIIGDAPDEELGQHVDCGADAGGDTRPDLLIGARAWPGDGEEAGAALVFLDPGASAGVLTASDAQATLMGEARTNTGSAVAWMDLDADGQLEPLVAAEADDAAGTDAGAVYGVLGLGW